MRPLRLILRAFGPYAGEQVLDFADLRNRSFFLIHGATGAGKTSILDGMCFALYGTGTGTRSGHQLRSDHADPMTATEVSFHFRLGDDRYRVDRSPEYERPKKRGEGTVRQPPRATLWKLNEGEGNGNPQAPGREEGKTAAHVELGAELGAPLASGWEAVNTAVERLMGFRVDQFRQVVMLPQGQFQKLLTARSDERQTILEALFQVQNYARVEQALKESASSLKEKIEAVRRSQAEVLVAAAVATLDELKQSCAAAGVLLAQARESAKALRDARQAAQERSAIAKRDAEKIAERETAAAELRKREARKDEFAQKEAAHAKACKASALAENEAEVHRLRRDAADREKRQAAAVAHLEAATQAKELADRKLAQENAREPDREQARKRAAELEELAGRVLELDKAQAGLGASRTKLEDAARQQTLARQSMERAKQTAARLAEELKQLDAAAAQTRALALTVKQASDHLAQRTRLEAIRRDAKAANAEHSLALRKLTQTRQQLLSARKVYDALHHAWVNGQAAVLARELSEGSPCPVCGSPHHPRPTTSDEQIPRAEVLDEQRALIEQLQKSEGEFQELHAHHEAAVAAFRASAAVMESALGQVADAALEVMRFDLDQHAAKLQQAEAAGIESAQKSQQLSGMKQQEESAAQRLAALDAAVLAATAELKSAEAIASERSAGVPEALRSSQALNREKRLAAGQLKQLTDGLEAARKASQEAALAHAAAMTSLGSAKAEFEAARALEQARRLEFVQRVKDAGFADYDAFKSSKLTEPQIEALDAEVRAFQLGLETARERFARAAAAAEGIALPDLEAIAVSAASAEQAVEQNVRQEQALASRVAQLDLALGRLGALEADLASLEALYQVTGHIAEIANGRNDYRMTFQRYVLGVFLDEVLYAASLRLRIMSRSRYTLQRLKDPVTGRSAGGLDLEVQDEWTGTMRPASTLSGGETFLASLALALGLADVVQAHAGGIRLETMFIDEGFGTLDAEALDLAIRALQDLQQGGRLVGIISHVSELKELIDARLEVTTGRRGSAARFVVS